jgi:hypothetical protein
VKTAKKDPAIYDIVIVGTSTWNGSVSPPVRTSLFKYKDKIKEIAFFCTTAASLTKIFAEMESICNKKPSASLVLEKYGSQKRRVC